MPLVTAASEALKAVGDCCAMYAALGDAVPCWAAAAACAAKPADAALKPAVTGLAVPLYPSRPSTLAPSPPADWYDSAACCPEYASARALLPPPGVPTLP